FSTQRLFTSGDYAYSSGSTIPEEGKPGNANLVIFDISDPAKPTLLEERDMQSTQFLAQSGTNLVGFKPGFDPVDNSFEDAEIQVYSVSDPANPTLIKTISLPATHGAEIFNAEFLESGLLYVTMETHTTDQTEAGVGTLLVDISANAGNEIELEIDPTCHAAVQKGSMFYCFSTQDYGSLDAITYDLNGTDGTEEISIVASIGTTLPKQAVVLPNGEVVMADLYRGLRTFETSGIGGEIVSERTSAIESESASAILLYSGSKAVVGIDGATTVLDLVTGNVTGTSAYSAGGLSTTSQPGIYASAMGNDGFLLFKITASGTFQKVGGYFHKWNTDLFEQEQSEGNY
ncbi:MAG: hypothetical protein AAB425_04410, partial [Bdellovibrionota bacterium]